MKNGLIEPIEPINVNDLSFLLHTPCGTHRIPLTKPEHLLKSKHFDLLKPVALYVSGWLSSNESENIQAVARAYKCRGDYNFLVKNFMVLACWGIAL